MSVAAYTGNGSVSLCPFNWTILTFLRSSASAGICTLFMNSLSLELTTDCVNLLLAEVTCILSISVSFTFALFQGDVMFSP